MKDTIQLTRSAKTEEKFQAFLKEWTTKHPDLGLLDEQSVDYLRDLNIPIERIQDLSGNQYYLLDSPFKYAGAKKHHILYMGISDYPPVFVGTAQNPNNPRFRSFVTVIQNGLVSAATVRSVQNGYTDYLIVVRSEKEWSETVPYVQMILYSDAVQADNAGQEQGEVPEPER